MFILSFLWLVVLSVYDISQLKIPNHYLTGFLSFVVAISISKSNFSVVYNFITCIFFFLIFLAVALLTKGLGSGDIKLISILAYISGFFGTIRICLIASLLGMIFFGVIKFIKRNSIEKIPFAPFLSAGYFLSGIIRW